MTYSVDSVESETEATHSRRFSPRDFSDSHRSKPVSHENKALVRRFFDALNQGKLDVLDQVLAPDFRTQGENQGSREGKTQLWQQLKQKNFDE